MPSLAIRHSFDLPEVGFN